MEIVIETSIDPQLYRAVRSNDVEMLRHLADADNNMLLQKTPSGKTVLHIAAKYGNKEVVEEVCRRCTTLLTMVDSYGMSPLHVAARDGHFEIVEVLIRHAKMAQSQVMLEMETSGATGLQWAVKMAARIGPSMRQRKSQLQKMLEMKTSEGYTALQWAIRMGHLEVVKVFTNEQPVDASLIRYAAMFGHQKIVDYILSVPIERDPSLHRRLDGPTPLHIAINRSRFDAVNKLISLFPEYATSIDDDGDTPLHIAAMQGQLRTVQKLLEVNATTIYYKNKEGDYPIHKSVWGGHIDVYREFIQRFPDTGDMIGRLGFTVLHIAVVKMDFKFVRYILETTHHNEIINAGDKDGDTAVHLAVMGDLIWIVFLLLDDKRVNAAHKNKKGQSPLDIASSVMEWGIPFSQKAAIWLALSKLQGVSSSILEKYRGDRQSFTLKSNADMTWKNTANTLLVVAALIATVTFAAIFTLPGGYEDSGSDQGFAHFRKKALFQVLLLDALAMFSSLVAALLVIVANWTDYLGLKFVVPWALKMTSFSFITMSMAFSWALGLMTNYTWALVLVSLWNTVIVLLIFVLFGFNSPAYLYWRVCVTLRRVRRAITPNC